jgi:L-ascorbate metabolism protein UlaG (beta-lactamase superfamily)
VIIPVQKDQELLKDIEHSRNSSDIFNLWWLGQSGFLVQWKNHHLLLDPYLSDSLKKKYAQTDKPHVRMTELVIQPQQLNFIDVVTSTHNHTDHLDAETLIPLRQVNPGMKIVVPKANLTFAAERLGCLPDELVGMDDGDQKTFRVFTLTAVPAAHETIERDEKGQHKYLGYIVQMGPYTLYHSGDTVWYEGMEERLRSYSIDVALLPINGRKPERRVSGNLWGEEAARLAKESGIRYVIPCHFEMFEFNTVTPDEFIQSCTRYGVKYRVLQCGEKWSSVELDTCSA